jgi:molybdenum-dependent DNA-binding transcriptional regulator ModE
MADIDEKPVESDVGSGEKLSKTHLLALVFELGSVKASLAAQKLGVSYEVVEQWVRELESDGWVRILDAEVGEPKLEVTEYGMHRKHELIRDFEEQRQLVSEAREVREPVKEKLKHFVLKLNAVFIRLFKLFLSNVKDVLILFFTAISAYLFYQFLLDPNAAALNFLFVAVLISLVLIMYRQYEAYLKTRTFISFLEWIPILVKKHHRYIALILTFIFLIYLTGMVLLYPKDIGVYIMGYVLAFTTGILFYYHRKSVSEGIRFYVGMIQLTYSLLLITGLLSITEPLLVAKSRLIDVTVGILLLLIVQLNEAYFGVGAKEFKRMIKRIR